MPDEKRPVSHAPVDLGTADARPFRTTMLAVALFSAVVLVNGLLAIALIEFLQSVGWWEVRATEAAEDTAGSLSARVRIRAVTG